MESCPMGAISLGEVAHVNLDRCIGCGVCAYNCPMEAVKVFRKEKDREFIPEKNIFASAMAIYRQRRSA
jgi:Fe-S-cluster-containing hydrogenase component 2